MMMLRRKTEKGRRPNIKTSKKPVPSGTKKMPVSPSQKDRISRCLDTDEIFPSQREAFISGT
jgi:hypothetical protein